MSYTPLDVFALPYAAGKGGGGGGGTGTLPFDDEPNTLVNSGGPAASSYATEPLLDANGDACCASSSPG